MARGPRGIAYVDTGAFISFLDRSDSHHVLFRRLFSDPPRMVTTPLVVAEGHGWFLRRCDGEKALRFLSFLDGPPRLEIEEVGPAELEAAAEYLRRFADQPLTLADAVGLHVMRRRRIRLCWSADRHLTLSGAALVVHGGD